MTPKAAVLVLVVLAVALVPFSQSDGASDFKASYDSITEEELDELLGAGYMGSINRYVLETAGINASGSGCPLGNAETGDIRFGLQIDGDRDSVSDSDRKQMETSYAYYLEYDMVLSFKANSSGYDAFNEEITGDAFRFESYSANDSGTISGHVRLTIDVDMRETASRQADGNVYAINSSTVIRTSCGVIDLEASFQHEYTPCRAEIDGRWDTRSVTVSDFIYPDEENGIEPGDEVYCRWSSREDSADVSIRFQTDGGTFDHVRDIGECTSGTSHGAVPDSFFQNVSEVAEVEDYPDSVSAALKEFARGELAGEYMRDDGLDPFKEPERIEEGIWQPAMSLIAAAIFVVMAVAKMHEGVFRY